MEHRLGLAELREARRPTLSQGQRGWTLIARAPMEELPVGTTHALLLRDGRTFAQGPAADVLTSDQVGKCFDLPLTLERRDGRWSVRIRRPA